MSIEHTILGELITNEDYSRSVLAFLDKEYFSDQVEKVLFSLISHYTQKYNVLPSKEVLLIDLEKVKGLSQDSHDKIVDLVSTLKKTEADKDWLLTETEAFCKNKSIFNAIMKSISIYENKDKESVDSIPQLLTDAVSVSFDQYIGHDYLEQAEERWEFYNRKDTKISFEVDMLNKITEGGISLKSLTIFLAGVHVGKSLIMCSMAAHNLICGHNVLYVTLEMAEEVVSQRIDANLMGLDMSDLKTISKEAFKEKADKLRKKTTGKLIVKEYPTASINANHLRHLLNELKLKKNFVPNIIYIDYLNLMTSFRSKGENSYTTIKCIAEELRGLAVEMNLPVVSATQLTRCLDLNSIVYEETKGNIKIVDLEKGDMVLSNSGYNKVEEIYDIEENDVYEITLKNGKNITCSSRHLFPSNNGVKSISTGLATGDRLTVLQT